MTQDERAIPTELREDARQIVTRIQDCHAKGQPVPEGRLWAAADTLSQILDRLDTGHHHLV